MWKIRSLTSRINLINFKKDIKGGILSWRISKNSLTLSRRKRKIWSRCRTNLSSSRNSFFKSKILSPKPLKNLSNSLLMNKLTLKELSSLKENVMKNLKKLSP
jgi:hypothetical protein